LAGENFGEFGKMTLRASCLGHTDINFRNAEQKVGQPLATGDDVDQQIQNSFLEMRKKGLPVNTSVAIDVGEGILLNKNVAFNRHFDQRMGKVLV